MLKHFLLLSQNADSSRNDVTDASGTTTDPSQVNGTQDPLQSNNAPVHHTPVGSVATTLPGIPAQHVKTNVSSDVTLEPLPAKPNQVLFLVLWHNLSIQVCPVMSLWNHFLQNLT